MIAIEPGSVATPNWSKGKDHAAERDIPPELEPIYRKELEVALEAATKTGERGIEPEDAAEVIATALTAGRPRPRYLVGRDARFLVAAQAVRPTRAFDRVMRRAMAFP